MEKELCKVTNIKPKKGEDRQVYLKRLVTAATELDDGVWEKLDTPTHDWVNQGALAIKDDQDVPDFETEEDVAANRKTKSTKKVKSKTAAPAETKKVKAKAANDEGKVRKGGGAQHMIKTLVCKNPQITTEEIENQLKKKGHEVTPLAVAQIRSSTRNTLKIAQENGVDLKSVKF